METQGGTIGCAFYPVLARPIIDIAKGVIVCISVRDGRTSFRKQLFRQASVQDTEQTPSGWVPVDRRLLRWQPRDHDNLKLFAPEDDVALIFFWIRQTGRESLILNDRSDQAIPVAPDELLHRFAQRQQASPVQLRPDHLTETNDILHFFLNVVIIKHGKDTELLWDVGSTDLGKHMEPIPRRHGQPIAPRPHTAPPPTTHKGRHYPMAVQRMRAVPKVHERIPTWMRLRRRRVLIDRHDIRNGPGTGSDKPRYATLSCRIDSGDDGHVQHL